MTHVANVVPSVQVAVALALFRRVDSRLIDSRFGSNYLFSLVVSCSRFCCCSCAWVVHLKVKNMMTTMQGMTG